MTRPWHEMTALALGGGIGAGDIDPVALAEHFLGRIAEIDGAHTIYLRTTEGRALAEARAARERARAGVRLGPLDGVPISWKDLYDTAGVTTTGGTPIFADRVPDADATVLARASRAGLVCLGKTNLTEFAFSGLAINPHFGTPANPFDDAVARVPGGSSSGAAVSVARGLAAAAIGSDTGGSVRVPAAWNGLVGLKTTVGVLPLDGVIPLAPSLDTVGPLTRDVADANALFAVLAAQKPADLGGASLAGERLAVADTAVWDRAEPGVEAAARAAIERLAAAGAEIVREEVPEFTDAKALMKRYVPLVVAEAYAEWRDLVETRPDAIFHNVLTRFRQGAGVAAAEVGALRRGLARIAPRLHARMARSAALLAPTVAISPPPIADLMADEDAYYTANLMAVHNTTLGNVLGLCAITLPCGGDGNGLPVGLMLMAPPRQEGALLRTAAAAEAALRGVSSA